MRESGACWKRTREPRDGGAASAGWLVDDDVARTMAAVDDGDMMNAHTNTHTHTFKLIGAQWALF